MITDSLTVLWRELIYLWRGSRSLMVILRYLAFVAIFGAIVPWQAGPAWFGSPLPLLYLGWLATYLAAAATSGSFAREREQHTLESLLATRLPDSAILLGKISAGVAYAGVLVAASLLLGQLVVGLKPGVDPAIYRPSVGLGGFIASLLAAFAIGALSSLTSITAQTVRQAQASLSLILLVLFLPLIAGQFVPGLQEALQTGALSIDTDAVILAVLLALALVDVALWMQARRAFRRPRLVRLA